MKHLILSIILVLCGYGLWWFSPPSWDWKAIRGHILRMGGLVLFVFLLVYFIHSTSVLSILN